MRHALKPLVRRPEGNLAAWVSALGAGCPCFCCGSHLDATSTSNDVSPAGAPDLVCSVCGAQVYDELGGAWVPAVASLLETEPELVAA